MISKYTTGSKIHMALERIYLSGLTAQDLRKEINYKESILRLEEFIISPLIFDGFVVKENRTDFHPHLVVTKAGEQKYISMGPVKIRKPKVDRISNLVGTYAGLELKPFEGRPGSMDHMKYPSLMGEVRFYRVGK